MKNKSLIGLITLLAAILILLIGNVIYNYGWLAGGNYVLKELRKP